MAGANGEIMRTFSLFEGRDKPLRILCIGAHSDDIEIGAGGTLMTLLSAYPVESVFWQVFCSNKCRKAEAEKSAGLYLRELREKTVDVKDFRDGFLPYIGCEVKDHFERIKSEYQPDLIFTHCRNDLHQDHRLLCELTWNTFRNHLILEYEICKYDGDLGRPNAFVEISPEIMKKKIGWLNECFASQSGKPWFDDLTFTAIMRLRGMECAAETGFAEAFYVSKLRFR